MKLLSVAVLIVALVACSPVAPSAPPDPRAGAPLPAQVRDVGSLATDPCRALDNPSAREFGFGSPGELRPVSTGDRSCWWTAPDDSQFLSVILFPRRDPLVDAYRLRRFAIFEPLSVGNFPATREQASAESTSCTVTVGVAEGQGFVATVDDQAAASGRRENQACGVAQQVAERIVAALPPLPGK
jgi:hypothetical protein